MNDFNTPKETENDLEFSKKKALLDYNKAINELKLEQNKKRIKFFIIIGLLIIVFKITIGTLEITNPFTYNKNRLYELKLNDTTITVNSTDQHRIPFIPFFVYLNTYNTTIYYGSSEPYLLSNNYDKYILNIESYSCYARNVNSQIRCDSTNNPIKKKNTDTVYTNLYIRKNGKPEIVVYNGKMINNITPYIQQRGYYYIQVTAKYNNVKTNISFNVLNKN